MVLSEDVQRAAFEGDLETITAWMASNDVNDTVVLLHGVRAAGSWRGFVNTRYYQPLARLRGLASRGHATTEDRMLASLFALPHQPFRIVLSFWRVLPSWFFSPRSIRGADN